MVLASLSPPLGLRVSSTIVVMQVGPRADSFQHVAAVVRMSGVWQPSRSPGRYTTRVEPKDTYVYLYGLLCVVHTSVGLCNFLTRPFQIKFHMDNTLRLPYNASYESKQNSKKQGRNTDTGGGSSGRVDCRLLRHWIATNVVHSCPGDSVSRHGRRLARHGDVYNRHHDAGGAEAPVPGSDTGSAPEV